MSLSRVLTLTTVVGVGLVASSAYAQDDVDQTPIRPRHQRFESPQHFALELRGTAYTTDIDTDPALGGKTPFHNLYGSAPRVLLGAEFDWQAIRIPHLGSLGPGVSAGFTTFSALAPFTETSLGLSAETTSLSVYPFAAMLVLRADAVYREAGIPVVPYAKLGLGYAIWRSTTTLGTANYDGVVGVGYTVGVHAALGLALNMNIFDSYAAQNLDDSLGINYTYIFAEWTVDDLRGLGLQNDPLRVGGENWSFGFAFEF